MKGVMKLKSLGMRRATAALGIALVAGGLTGACSSPMRPAASSTGASGSAVSSVPTPSTTPSLGKTDSSATPSVTVPGGTATFETDGAIGSKISPNYQNWYAVKLTLRGWPANSTVNCSVTATVSGLVNWSGSYRVDENGGWGPARLTKNNSSGYLQVQTSAFLPDDSNCS
jgi:hypothetical protein